MVLVLVYQDTLAAVCLLWVFLLSVSVENAYSYTSSQNLYQKVFIILESCAVKCGANFKHLDVTQ